MNTHKRQMALRRARDTVAHAMAVARGSGAHTVSSAAPQGLAHPACVPGPGRSCEHPLVDRDLNAALHRYEQTIRGRFEAIEEVLRALSARQHDQDFAHQAQSMSEQRLGFRWPDEALDNAWVSGVDMARLYAHGTFRAIGRCIERVDADQAPWRTRLPVQPDVLRSCGYHTVDISPCADGRLQGLLPFILRTAANEGVLLKAYAGALFDIENDVSDWSQRQLERIVAGHDPRLDYLKVAVYHFSSSSACDQGCAAHGSQDHVAIAEAIARLQGLHHAVAEQFGPDMAPDLMLMGLDTDLDAIRIHLPDALGRIHADRFLDSASLYRETVGMESRRALDHIRQAIAGHVNDLGGLGTRGNEQGMQALAGAWLVANLSQIEYVIEHHAGRYAVIGHDEHFICAGDLLEQLQLRNQFYYAHLDTVEEGAADLDVGVRIFTGLNTRRGLPLPVLVHFAYASAVPGSRERAVQRGRRVAAAVQARYPDLHARGLLQCEVAVSDRRGREPLSFVGLGGQDTRSH
ncbi:MAG: carboxysome shell carbonic anhydrase [Burkholderiales bacterium]|nr:MAG: carboxysome shell carbonic anhydrase [Burkholderiales bacterium]